MIKSLWGDEFDIEETPLKNKQLLNKLKNPKKIEFTERSLNSKNLSIPDRLELININVNKILGKQKENILVIRDRKSFSNYISKAIENGIISIDTETNNSLDPLTCKLMGPCIHTPNEKHVYIPINHINYLTEELLPNQLTEQDVKEEFQRLLDNNVKIIMHNANFDWRVIKCTCNIELKVYWDTMLAARMLDENERSAGLKQQYIDKIDQTQEKYNIEHLFENVLYEIVDPEIFALYAATDAYMTTKLYEWQVEAFKNPDLNGVYKVFMETEMPLMYVASKMQLRGIKFDTEYNEKLKKKYHKILEKQNAAIQSEVEKYRDKINDWRLTKEANEKPPKKSGKGFGKSKNEQLPDIINPNSATQLSIIMFDILQYPIVNKENPRSTGKEELKALLTKTQSKLCEILLAQRSTAQMIGMFVDSLPNEVNKLTGRIHCNINQMGTDTGRISSSNPNLQQLPRDIKDIRAMFRASKGKNLIGADFSQLEVKTSVYCSQDTQMLQAYLDGKDLYSVVASMAFEKSYEDCLEFYPEGTVLNIDGMEIICGNEKEKLIESIDNTFIVPYYKLVETTDGFKTANTLNVNDILITDENNINIKEILVDEKNIIIKV